MVAAGSVRANGQTTAANIAEELAEELTEPMKLEEPKQINLTRGFQRMRTDWNSEDRRVMDRVIDDVEDAIFQNFHSAQLIRLKIWGIVREPIVDESTGEIEMDSHGWPVHKRNADGSFIEHWDQLGRKAREDFIFQIETHRYDWEQKAANIWGEALFAKSQWQEAFENNFDEHTDPKAPVDARTARANKMAAELRYFSVYKTMYSKKADALVRSMIGISQRFKDTLTA